MQSTPTSTGLYRPLQRSITLFSALIIVLLMAACSEDTIIEQERHDAYSPLLSFEVNTSHFFSDYLGKVEGLNVLNANWRSDDNCTIDDPGCVHYNGYVDTVRLDTPSLCEVIVTVDIQVCQLDDSTHQITFDPVSYQIVRPDSNDANERWCTDWFRALDSCAAINDTNCLKQMLRQVELAAADAIELAFVSDYVRFYNDVFECGDDQTEPRHKVVETQYFLATCIQGCELTDLNGNRYSLIQDCGSGCCIEKHDYCQNELGGVTRGPAYYEYTQGLCGVIPTCKENGTIFTCTSVECPE